MNKFRYDSAFLVIQVKEDGAAAMSANYPSDVTDEQWQVLRKLLPKRARLGRPPIDRRRIVNAVLYLNRTGCQWRMLPRDFPKWKTVYTIFRRWRLDGVWQRMNEALVRLVRKAAGKKPTPSAAILDSQSIRTAEGGECRGYDGGKKITGRKRHLAVDTLGLIWAVVVHGADWRDYEGGHFVLAKLRNLGRLRVVFADSIYGRCGLPEWVSETFGWVLQTVLRPVRASGFVVLPKRWIVERTFAWISRCRRHSKDYERTVESSEAMIYITMIGLMSRRLARQKCI
jgi:putative transposase